MVQNLDSIYAKAYGPPKGNQIPIAQDNSLTQSTPSSDLESLYEKKYGPPQIVQQNQIPSNNDSLVTDISPQFAKSHPVISSILNKHPATKELLSALSNQSDKGFTNPYLNAAAGAAQNFANAEAHVANLPADLSNKLREEAANHPVMKSLLKYSLSPAYWFGKIPTIKDVKYADPNRLSTQLGGLGGDVLSYLTLSGMVPGTQGLIPSSAREAAIFGATAPTGSRVSSAALGAAFPIGLEALKGAPAIVKKFAVDSQAKNIVKNLTEAANIEENDKLVAKTVKSGFEKAKVEGKKGYDDFFNNIGDNPVFRIKQSKGLLNQAIDNLDSEFLSSPRKTLSSVKLVAKDNVNKFLQDPSLRNLHELKSKLGSEIAGMNRQKFPIRYGNLMSAKESIENDISSYLKSNFPDQADNYRKLTENWNNEVVPYQKGKIRNISLGKKENPVIATTFSRPEKNISKIASDLNLNHKILYSKLAKGLDRLKAQDLIERFNDLKDTGHSSYITPELNSQIAELKHNMKLLKIAKIGGGAAGAGLVGTYYGKPIESTVAGALGTAALPVAKKIVEKIAK